MSLHSMPALSESSMIPGQLIPQQRKANKLTDACVAYLTTREYRYFDWLVGLLFRAKGNLFLAAQSENRFSQFSRDSLAAQTRAFIVGWLSEFLDKYSREHLTENEVRELADLGEFRHLGRQCRFALIKTFRTSSQDALDQTTPKDETTYWDNGHGLPAVVSLDDSIDTDEYGGELSLEDFVVGSANGASALGFTPSVEPEDLIRIINTREAEFKQLLGPELFDVLKCATERFPDVRHISRSVAVKFQVSQRYARTLLVSLRASLHSARLRQGALAHELYHLRDGQANRAAAICTELRAGLNAAFELYCLLAASGKPSVSFMGSATSRKPAAE